MMYDKLCVDSDVDIINETNQLISNNPMTTNQLIIDTIKRATDVFIDNSLTKILRINYFEQVVPYNLWFNNDKYMINHIRENNQYIRTRVYNNTNLTPLVSERNFVLSKYVTIDMSLYQPFYPETFYSMWELLQTKYLQDKFNDFLYIGREERLGILESIIFYQERYYSKYQQNNYSAWITGKEMFDIYGNYHTTNPLISYLTQAYHVDFIINSKDFKLYDFIVIDCTHLFDDIFTWSCQEYDFQSTLFYVLSTIQHVKVGGSMAIRLNMISNTSWLYLMEILYSCFNEHIFFRPTVLHAYNSEIFLYLAKYNGTYKPTYLHTTLKVLFKSKLSKCFNINFNKISNNELTIKYNRAVNQWINGVDKMIDSLKNPQSVDLISKHVEKWHKSYHLNQIKELTNDFDWRIVLYKINCTDSQLVIKSIPATKLYQQKHYINITEKRAELNYYKRVMDTKPSLLFTNNRYSNKNSRLLNWETLSNKIDLYQNLKYIIRKKYCGEMVTNAWIKMYEILNIYDDLLLIKTQNKPTIKTFHLCEAPGAFIAATNHYLTTRNIKLDWYAQTLRPTNENIESDAKYALDDYFGLIAAHKNRWIFGSTTDSSGDITHSEVIRSYATNPKLSNIDFMTADAGLKCDPADLNEQESYLGKINMGQIICILACLSIGKSAVFKTFLPMSEPLTISMIYVVTHLFIDVEIIKPVTSHSSNSEVYVLLRNYKGIDKNVLEMLYTMLDDPNITPKSLLFNQLSSSFFNSYFKCTSCLIDRQIASLKRCYYYYYNYDQVYDIKPLIDQCTNEWLNRNKLRKLTVRLC